MSIRDIIEGKRQWRAHVARVRALPPDYQIVYEELQKYLFKVGPLSLTDGNLLSELIDFFEGGVAEGRGVTELIGTNVVSFCDGLIGDAPTYADLYGQAATRDRDRSRNPNHG